MEWNTVPISSICEGIYEGPHATPPNCESGACYLGIPALTEDGHIEFSKVPFISKEDYVKWTKRVTPRYGDIVFTNEATLNLYARIPKDFYGCLGRRLGLVRPLQDKVVVDYLFYYFFSPYWRNIISLKKVSGSTVERILMKKFPSFPVVLPPLPIQQKIASILSTYDNLIENNTKRIKLLEQMAENLYKEWFVRFRFPGHENVEMENGLPKGWKEKRLGDWGIDLDTGSRPKGGIDDSIDEGIPSLGAESIKDLAVFDYASVKYIPLDFYEKMKRGKNSGNDILLYKDGAYIGKVTLFRDGFPYDNYSINEHVFFVSPIDKDYQNYLFFTLHQDTYFSLMQNLNRNAAQPGLSRPDISRIKITIPSKEVIEQYNSFVEPMLCNLFKLAKQNQLLTRQRDLLLPRLMSGKLVVRPFDVPSPTRLTNQ